MRPFRLLVRSMFALVVATSLPCAGMFAGILMLVPASSLLFVLGLRIYQMNRRRIADGKSSISVGRSGARASFDHRLNQAVAVFYMMAGAVIMALTLTAPLRW